jgi:ATP synthase protein I
MAPLPRTSVHDAVPGAAGLVGGYRKAEPYVSACNSLVGSVVGCTFLGYWLDRWMGHSVLWLLVVGAILGMVVGFVSFFFQIARAGRSGGSAPPLHVPAVTQSGTRHRGQASPGHVELPGT